MTKERVKYGIASVISVALMVLYGLYINSFESTDVLVTALCFAEGLAGWYVMVLSLIAELVIIKLFLKESWLKSVTIVLVMNMVSLILGMVTSLIVGLLCETVLYILPNTGTLHISHWAANFLAFALINAVVEGLVIKIGFKYKFKKIFWWLCLANVISLIICFLFNLDWIQIMHF